MNRVEFEAKIAEIRGEPELAGMMVAVIVFTDGERHLTQTWSVQPGDEYVEYIDVHCDANSTPIRIQYRLIANVQDYCQKMA